MTLYIALVEHAGESGSFLQTFWCDAATIGAAIGRITAGATVAGVPPPSFIAELDPFGAALPDEAGRILDDVWCAEESHWFPSEYQFRLPNGVVKSYRDGEFDLSEMLPGFALSEHGPSIQLEAVVEAPALLDTYLGLVRALGTYDVSWITLQDDWEDGGEIAYVNEAIGRADLLQRFLARHRLDLVDNGHVTITAFARAGSTNVNLTDHKTIEVWTTSRDICNTLVDALRSAGIPPTDRLVSIEDRFHHWHYRPAGSRDRAGLISLLRSEGFSPWHPKPHAEPDR